MLKLLKMVHDKAVEAKIKLIGIITLAFSFLSPISSKSCDSGKISFSEEFNDTIFLDVSHLESSQYADTIELYFRSSSSITISKIKISVGKFGDELSGDSIMQFEKDRWYIMGEYEGVESGQEWAITFYGREVSSNRKFKATTRYVVNKQ